MAAWSLLNGVESCAGARHDRLDVVRRVQVGPATTAVRQNGRAVILAAGIPSPPVNGFAIGPG